MRKITVAITVVEALILILLVGYFTTPHNSAIKDVKSQIEKPFPQVTGNAIITPAIPSNCSEDSIKALWDSIFKETSSGINIISSSTDAGKCNNFTAYKIKNNQEVYVIDGVDMNLSSANITTIAAIFVNFSTNYFNSSKSIMTQINVGNITQRNITSTEAATAEFSNYFRAIPTTMELDINSNNTRYHFTEDSSGKSQSGYLMINYSFNLFMFIKSERPNCTPNWTAIYNNCSSNDRRTIYYNDTNNCNNFTTIPANISDYCDYDNNSIIGSPSTINFIRITPAVKINSTDLNLSLNYSETQKIIILDINKTMLEFDWNFTSGPLTFDAIKIEKQNATADAGYLLINGIEKSKTAYLDRLNNYSNKVCIRDNNLSSIDNLTQLCEGVSEWIIPCPGSNQSWSCNITEDNRFKISGLMHSAIKEIVPINYTPACIPATCASLNKTCGNIIESQCNITLNCGSCDLGFTCSAEGACIEATPICVPDWNCSNWKPITCTSKTKNQTRTCKDINNCGSSDNKPPTIQECPKVENPSSGSNIIVWIFVGILVLLAAIALGIILWLKSKNNSGEINPVGGSGITFPPAAPPAPINQPIIPAQPSWMPKPQPVPQNPQIIKPIQNQPVTTPPTGSQLQPTQNYPPKI